MQNDYYNNNKKNIYIFIVIPILLNLLLMGFYFSGISFLQNIVSPYDDFLTRESGLLEQLQNLYLISIFTIFFYLAIKRSRKDEKIFFSLLSAVFLFLFLEEIDYGMNLYEFFLGHSSGEVIRNWHNQSTNGGKQNVEYFKQIIDLANVIWFIILPLFASKIKIPLIKSIIPNKYFIVGFALTAILSSVAHYLDNLGLSEINGHLGSLTGNISEFREHNTYYLYLLYAIQIANAKLVIKFKSSN